MDVKKHTFVACYHCQTIGDGQFSYGCHECLVQSIVRLCELLDENPTIAQTDPTASANGLTEVFQGTHVAHITEGKITNVTALPMTPADLEEGIVRYTVEFRKDS